MPSVWEPDADGPSQSPEGDDLTRGHAFNSQSVPLPKHGLPALPPADATRGRRWMGVASWGIWPGCDRAGGDAAVPAAAQHPADPRRALEARTRGGSTDGDRSALSL